MAEVVQLLQTGGLRTPIDHAIRTGEVSYRQLEHLDAEGRVPARAVVIDAPKARFQKEFIRSLRASAADVALDPKVAELGELGKFSGSVKGTPWAVEDARRPLEPDGFEPGADTDLFGKTAQMADEAANRAKALRMPHPYSVIWFGQVVPQQQFPPSHGIVRDIPLLGVQAIGNVVNSHREMVSQRVSGNCWFRNRDLKTISSAARSRQLVACGDRECCPRGLTSMLDNHRSHIARQNFRAIDALFAVPDARGVDHFTNVDLRSTERLAGDLVHLDIDDATDSTRPYLTGGSA